MVVVKLDTIEANRLDPVAHREGVTPNQPVQGKLLREMRCPQCRRLLARADIRDGTFQVLCPKCKIKVEISTT